MSVLGQMTKSAYDFDGIDTMAMARQWYGKEISKLWDKTRITANLEELDDFTREAKRFSRQWRRYMLNAEANIDTDEPKISDYEKSACVLGTIEKDLRNPDHKELWIAVDKFVKGWKDYSGNMRDTETFSRLSDYNSFIVALSDYGRFYSDMLEKAGIV